MTNYINLPWYDNVIGGVIFVFAILWVLLLLMGAFRTGGRRLPGSGHVAQRIARDKSIWK